MYLGIGICTMQSKRHVVRIPFGAPNQPDLPFTSGWIRAMNFKVHLMLLGLCMLLLQHCSEILYVHLCWRILKPFVIKGNQNAYYKHFSKMVSPWLRIKIDLLNKRLEWNVYLTCLTLYQYGSDSDVFIRTTIYLILWQSVIPHLSLSLSLSQV
jgi:hypothetical protein